MSSLERGWHLSLPETTPAACPPSPPSMVERRGGIWRSCRWSGRLRYHYHLVVNRFSPPGPVGTRRPLPAVLMWPVEKLLPPYTLLQVHQAKALKDQHEGGHDPEVLSELRTATDLALRATTVTPRSLGRAMSTMVVQQRHLWLCLADMSEADNARVLEFPRVPDWPLRRRSRELCPTVFCCTESD